MKINAAIFKTNPKLRRKTETKIDRLVLVVAGVISSGIIMGAVSYGLNSDLFSSQLWEYFFEFHYDFSNKSYLQVLSGIILSNLLYFFVMVVMATSAIGSYFILLPTLAKCLGLGTLVCYLYTSFGLMGLEYCFLVVFPGKIIFLLVMLLLTKNCYKLSSEIKFQLSGTAKERLELKNFFLTSFMIFLILLASSIMDSLMILLFSSLFEFC